jgi:hypothetical protein
LLGVLAAQCVTESLDLLDRAGAFGLQRKTGKIQNNVKVFHEHSEKPTIYARSPDTYALCIMNMQELVAHIHTL